MSISVSGSQITFNDASTQTTAATGFGFKNRIINGAMMIDQRYNGSAVTQNTSGIYGLDRWSAYGSVTSKFTMQRSTTTTTGFSNSVLLTSSAATTPGSTDTYNIAQAIEGNNFYDLSFGTANAKTVTLSFWVYSSVAGSFGAALQNYAVDRSYPFNYTVAANTWTYVTQTIPGDTSGTWVGASSAGAAYITFSMGAGSSKSASSSAWTAGNYPQVTGATNFVSTNGATLYITGVQLEKGSTATSFDYRPYGTELMLCQRYYERRSGSTYQGLGIAGNWYSATTGNMSVTFPVPKRTIPSSTYNNISIRNGGGFNAVTSLAGPYGTNDASGCIGCEITLGVASGGTTGYGASLLFSSGGGYLDFSAEL